MDSRAMSAALSSAAWLEQRIPQRGLKVEWHEEWDSSVDSALSALPEMPGCSHSLYRALARHGGAVKKHAIVFSKGDVVSVVSLRQRRGRWEPVTAICVPTEVVPLRGASLAAVLRATALEVHIPEFFGPPTAFEPRDLLPFDVYSVDLQSAYEDHWRASGYWKTMRSIRNRTAHLELRVDEPSDLDWTIDAWCDSWADDVEQMSVAAPDMRMSWGLLQQEQRIQTMSLLEDGRVLAGVVNLIDGDRLIGLCTARVADRPNYSLGTRLLDASFERSRELGYRTLDMGGWSEYKRRLAPVSGQRHAVNLQPPLTRAVLRTRALAASAKRRATRRLRPEEH